MDERLATILARHAESEGPLLPILHDVQAAFGCVSPQVQQAVAQALNLSRAEVHGVVSFYHDFTEEADPRPCIQLCRAEACQARGVEALVAQAEELAGNKIRIATVYCLGLCSVGPAARVVNGLVGEQLQARLDAKKLAQVMVNL
jgi:formate dehydrogenase subunit gamma